MTLLKSKHTFIISMLLGVLFYVPSLAQESATVVPDKEDDVAFSLIDEVPLYPGCESITSKSDRANCMRSKVSKFVNRRFNTGVADSLEAGVTHKILVNFRIDKNGSVADIQAEASYPELKEEAKRVIEELPKMEPGKQDGEPVGVLYSLPITFKIAE